MDKFFGISSSGSTVKTEIIAGITTFVTMAYIILVNPNMLGGAATAGMTDPAAIGSMMTALAVATCLSAAVGTLMMALYAKLPFAQAPGMGLNALFAFTICGTMGYTFNQGLAAVFISGILFIIITLCGLREMIVKAIPSNLKFAITAGIGLFIAFLGFQNAGIIVNNDATLVGLANLSTLADPATRGALLALGGVLLIAILMKWNVKGAILIGIVACTAVAFPLGLTSMPDMSTINFNFNISPTFFKLDLAGLLNVGDGSFWTTLGSIVTIVITLSLVDMFDTIGTLIGTATKAGLVDKDGNVKNMNKALLCDAVATTAGALIGTSTVTTYVESASGVAAGGKTGLTSLITGILFLLAIIIAPIVGIVPSVATAPALIIVGVLMIGAIKNVEFGDIADALPAFLTIIMMVLTYSIATGIAFGLISYPIIKVCTGKIKEVHPIVYVLAALFIIRFIVIGI